MSNNNNLQDIFSGYLNFLVYWNTGYGVGESKYFWKDDLNFMKDPDERYRYFWPDPNSKDCNTLDPHNIHEILSEWTKHMVIPKDIPIFFQKGTQRRIRRPSLVKVDVSIDKNGLIENKIFIFQEGYLRTFCDAKYNIDKLKELTFRVDYCNNKNDTSTRIDIEFDYLNDKVMNHLKATCADLNGTYCGNENGLRCENFEKLCKKDFEDPITVPCGCKKEVTPCEPFRKGKLILPDDELGEYNPENFVKNVAKIRKPKRAMPYNDEFTFVVLPFVDISTDLLFKYKLDRVENNEIILSCT